MVVADTGATVSRPSSWQYVFPGNVTSVAPSTGQVGTRVTIRGSGLQSGGSAIQAVRYHQIMLYATQLYTVMEVSHDLWLFTFVEDLPHGKKSLVDRIVHITHVLN